MKAGLRVDVDTFRGTRLGVPNLCEVLAQHGIRATFFFSVGPDNMGRHLWRLLRPRFLWKMLRTRAASLYGWDILLRGTFWPGPIMGKRCANVIRAAAAEHEIGLHAWDHHQWQARVDRMSEPALHNLVQQGFDLLSEVCGRAPIAFAAPSWKANEAVLRVTDAFPFRYQSDCRGTSVFRPVCDGQVLSHPQIPVTLPTYDEVVGPSGIRMEEYNRFILNQMRPHALNVLCIHAEVEGIACRNLFEAFLTESRRRNIDWVPLSDLLPPLDVIPLGRLAPAEIGGREGWVAVQG